MSTLKRRSSEATITTDTILSNARMPRSQSLLSLPQLLVSASMECLQNNSEPSISVSRSLLRTKQEQCDLIERQANSLRGEDCKISKPQIRSRRKSSQSRTRTSQASVTAQNGDGPHKGRQSMEKSFYNKKTTSKETPRSKERCQKQRRRTMIVHTDKTSTLRRTRKIPKWIYIEIKLDLPAAPPPPPEEPAPKQFIPRHKDLLPLADLAIILSNDLEQAVAKGLFDPESRAKKKKREAEPLTTSTFLSSLNVSLGDIPTEAMLAKYWHSKYLC